MIESLITTELPNPFHPANVDCGLPGAAGTEATTEPLSTNKCSMYLPFESIKVTVGLVR